MVNRIKGWVFLIFSRRLLTEFISISTETQLRIVNSTLNHGTKLHFSDVVKQNSMLSQES